MSDVKIYTTNDLKKMGGKDRFELLNDTLRQLGHQKLKVRTNEDKKSHMISVLEKQVARLKTIHSEPKPTKDEK